MLLLAILLLPVVLGAEREWNFGDYVIKTNEKNALTSIQKTENKTLVEVNLSNLGLENIEINSFDNVTDIKRLNLSNNWLSTLPKNVFSNLTSLQHLSLADNVISSFESVFIGLDNLQSLDLSNNPLKHIGESYLYGLSRWVYVSTRGNVFSNISTFLFEISDSLRDQTIPGDRSEIVNKLTVKDLPPNNYTAVKVCIDNYVLKSVEVVQLGESITPDCTEVRVSHIDLKLSLRYFDIVMFDKGWYRVQDLPVRVLDLADNIIVDMTSEILNDLPENVVEVDLSHNFIDILKPGIIENWYLRSLILDYDYIDKIQDDAFAKTNLSVLSLNYNELIDINFAKTLPSSLVEIRLSRNRISEITTTASLPTLKQLVKLDLSSNDLTTIEQGFFRNFGALRELNLYNNRINLYKGIFAGLECIEYLNIGMNQLKNVTKDTLFAMPDTLSTVILDFNGIKSLEAGSFVRVPRHKLSLEGNNITRIAKGSFDLASLAELNLGNNQLTEFTSDSFKGLASLKRLSLADNNIKTIQRGVLQYLKSLEILDLSLNPIKELLAGTLIGMVRSQKGAILLSGVPIERVQGTMFDSN